MAYQGSRVELPSGCYGDPRKYYIEMDYIWELLDQKTVVLIRGGWLLERSRAIPFEPLPCRQHLPPEAIIDIQELRRVEDALQEQLNKAYFILDHESTRKSIVAISHCWLTADHPDPHGNQLKELALICEAYTSSLPADVHGFDGAFFLAWCSMYQPYHALGADGQYKRQPSQSLTEEERMSHQLSLENMDIWYTHKRTEVWMLTKFFDGQGKPYADRGWTTWERIVAELLTDSNAVLDLGQLAEGQPVSMHQICTTCRVSRSAPVLPEEFANIIDGKHFTCGNLDRDIIKENYNRNFYQATSCATQLDYHNMSWTQSEVHALAKVLDHCTELQKLYLWGNQIDNAGAIEISLALYNCPLLQELNLVSNQIGAAGAIALARVLRHCRHLHKLFLEKNQVGVDGAIALAEALPCCSQLQILEFDENQIGDAGSVALAEALRHCSQLQRLYLGINQISDVGTIALAEALRHCIQLQQLDFYANQIGDEGNIALAQPLRHCGELQRLYLGANQIGDAGAIALAGALCHCSQLKEFFIHENKIGEAGIIALAKALRCCNKLQELWLGGNQIKDAAASALAEALLNCTLLQKLSLSGNQVCDAGAIALAELLRHCGQLQTLLLESNQISNIGASALAEAVRHRGQECILGI